MSEREKIERMKYQHYIFSREYNLWNDYSGDSFTDYVITEYNIFSKLKEYTISKLRRKGKNDETK